MAQLLASDRAAQAKIVLPQDPTPQELYAAQELRDYLDLMSSAVFEIVRGPVEDAQIALGRAALDFVQADESLGEDGFLIETQQGVIAIWGGKRGLIYGVYELLEQMGCRFFTATCEKVPCETELPAPELHIRQKPVLEYRDHNYYEFAQNPRFAVKARINGQFPPIKEKFGGVSFDRWPDEYKFAKKRSLRKFKAENQKEYLFWLFLQYEFSKQWNTLKRYANEKGVSIIGDIPLYVAYDSADVWLNPKLFKLNTDRSLKKVAGVPPDYFSATGQLWGNPVYHWAVHKKDNYKWWVERFRQAFELYDVVRVDHFRGLDRYYEIDAGETTAVKGKWKHGPKYELFRTAESLLGKLNIIAEDLGSLDKGVYRLMDETGYPGMKVMEFAFDGNKKNPYLPKNIKENSVCYTGTHDNDTLLGYINKLKDGEYKIFKESLEKTLKEENVQCFLENKIEMAKAIMLLTMRSLAYLAVIPIQDILLLGSRARMNMPSTSEGNWRFKLQRIPNRQELFNFCELVKSCERRP